MIAAQISAGDVAAPTVNQASPAPYAQSIAQLQARLVAGDCPGVRADLLKLLASGHDDNELQFLIGMAALCQKDWNAAITRFRTILARDPDAVRVRLELGRAYFEKGEMVNAERQFQFARAGRNPDAVNRNIDKYLFAIRRKRRLTASVSAALAPDSNISSGPSTDTIAIYGLPYTLSFQTRAHSGVGVALSAAASWAPPLTEHLRWDFDISGYGRFYRQAVFDDIDAVAATGPHLVYSGFDLAVHGALSRRWFDNAVYINSTGLTADAVLKFDGRDALLGGFSRNWLDYPLDSAQSGPLTTISTGLARLTSASSQVRLIPSYSWDDTRDPAFAARTPAIELYGLKEFRGGLSVTIDLRVARSRYGYFAAFGEYRRDTQYAAQLNLLHRRVSYKGFAPRVTVGWSANDSNIPVWSFRRTRAELGFTKVF